MNRKEMTEKLNSYKMENGYYDVGAIVADEKPEADSLSVTFATYFGAGDTDQESSDSELVFLARQLNAELAKMRDQAKADEASGLIAQLQAGIGNFNAITRRLEEIGAGQNIGNGEDQFFVLNQTTYGNQYEDQADLESAD